LHGFADDPRVPAARRHRTRIRIGERNLFVLALYQVEHLNAIDAASKILAGVSNWRLSCG
jgi:hypothetical protein